MFFDIFCTSPVENVSFVPETQDLPRKINSPCIFFLTKNYFLCGFSFCQNYFEVYSVVKIVGNFTFKAIFWSETVSGKTIYYAKMTIQGYISNCSSKTFLEFTQQYLFSEYVFFVKIVNCFVMKLYKYRPDVFCLQENFKERLFLLLDLCIAFPYSHKLCYFRIEDKRYKHLFITL